MKIRLYMNNAGEQYQWILDHNIQHTVLERSGYFNTFEIIPTLIEIPDDSADLDLFLLRWI